jgi:hypothetical protein
MTENQYIKLFQSIEDVEKFIAHTEIDAKSVAIIGQEIILLYEENMRERNNMTITSF